MATVSEIRSTAAGFGSQPLLISPTGAVLNLQNGYIPLLTDFTHEDKTAKGLRKRSADDKPQELVYFTALEVVRDNRMLLLTGPSGSGKTTFAKYLCFYLETHKGQAGLSAVRNESGLTHGEDWGDVDILPYYFAMDSVQALEDLVDTTVPRILHDSSRWGKGNDQEKEVLVIIDGGNWGVGRGLNALTKLVSLLEGLEYARLLVLSDSRALRSWTPPSGIARHNILPFLQAQRKEAVARLAGTVSSQDVATVGEASNPAMFGLALQSGYLGGQVEDILDAWLSTVSPDGAAAAEFTRTAYERFIDIRLQDGSNLPSSKQHLLSSTGAVQQLLAARHLETLPVEVAVNAFHQDSSTAEPVIRSLLVRLSRSGNSQDLVGALVQGSGHVAQRGALLVSTLSTECKLLRGEIATHMLAILNEATLSVSERERAGRVLSRLGDPRDLTKLTNVPGGTFTMGSDSHSNSQPKFPATVGGFKIGIYPVVNRDYALFIQDTGREWRSPDSLDPERQNAPATDLTWHDAREYCKWLTDRWRENGKITPTSQLRLPTEPEWERACNGDYNQLSARGPIYPWGLEWRDNAANYEETGLNNTTAVGLFPSGRSAYGCYDMAGQVWEWCTTLWGEDMSTPSFRYPWEDDGRESLDAPESIRRVLRGGCFSSGRLKAGGTYRGSLEPAGYWRGNGFRVVLEDVHA